jgi:hypothetical protein
MLGFDDPKFLELMRLGGIRGMIRLLWVTYLLEPEEVWCLNIFVNMVFKHSVYCVCLLVKIEYLLQRLPSKFYFFL